MNPKFFSSAAEFRAWLKKHGGSEKELIVGFHKVDSGKPSMSWSESVDEALCFGLIDGVRTRTGSRARSRKRPGNGDLRRLSKLQRWASGCSNRMRTLLLLDTIVGAYR